MFLLCKVRVFLAVACSALCITTAFAADMLPNGKVAFTDEFEPVLEIVDVKSGKITYSSVGPVFVRDLAYNKLKRVFALEASGGHDDPSSIYLFWRASKKLTRIFHAKSYDDLMRPTFDPAGQYVYALNYGKGILRYPLAGGKWEKVKIVGKEVTAPQMLAFSRSGAYVAISPSHFNSFLIAIVTADGLHVDREILTDFRYCTSPQWVGDDAIIFAGINPQGISSLWKYNLSSGALEQLKTASVAVRDFISLSNDEQSVVFTGATGGKNAYWHLWLLKLDGSEPVQITKDRRVGGGEANDLHPVWLD